jgi:hypothetical protein
MQSSTYLTTTVELEEDQTYISRIKGLDSFRTNTKPLGRSLKSVLKKVFSRYKRDTDHQEKLILKRPLIFEKIRKPSKPNKNVTVPKHNIPKTYLQVHSTPSSLYEVPHSITGNTPTEWDKIPQNTPSRFYEVHVNKPSSCYEVPVNKPSSFYEVPVNTPSSFYEVPPPYES